MTNTGINLPLGGSNLITLDINPAGDWLNYLPPAEDQFSQDHLVDTMACVSYSATHCIESQIKLLTGSSVSYSERFLAKMSGTTPQGNWLTTVADTIKKYGMVLDTDWPEPPVFTWDSYYAEIPADVIAKGQEFLKNYNVTSQFITNLPTALQSALQQAPLQIIITKEVPHHAVELLNKDFYFDTYPT